MQWLSHCRDLWWILLCLEMDIIRMILRQSCECGVLLESIKECFLTLYGHQVVGPIVHNVWRTIVQDKLELAPSIDVRLSIVQHWVVQSATDIGRQPKWLSLQLC